jgi:hypothetical protein
MLSRSSFRRFVLWIAVAAAMAAPVACGGGESSTDRFEAAAKEAQSSTVPPSTSEDVGGDDQPPSEETTTTLAGGQPAGESLLRGVDAYTAELGPAIRALQYTQHFPVDSGSYASLQSQDPAKPQNVDQRDWRDGKVGDPQPVQLTTTPGASLEENLFTMSEINWPAIAAAMPGAPALVEQKLGTALENSDGVTHIIAEKDLPFTSNTVVRVYVDGGDRTSGGYVEYLSDGTVAEVQA